MGQPQALHAGDERGLQSLLHHKWAPMAKVSTTPSHRAGLMSPSTPPPPSRRTGLRPRDWRRRSVRATSSPLQRRRQAGGHGHYRAERKMTALSSASPKRSILVDMRPSSITPPHNTTCAVAWRTPPQQHEGHRSTPATRWFVPDLTGDAHTFISRDGAFMLMTPL